MAAMKGVLGGPTGEEGLFEFGSNLCGARSLFAFARVAVGKRENRLGVSGKRIVFNGVFGDGDAFVVPALAPDQKENGIPAKILEVARIELASAEELRFALGPLPIVQDIDAGLSALRFGEQGIK
jgi:hypothetical protein